MRTWKKAMVTTLVACTLAIPGLASAEEMMMKKFDYSKVTMKKKDGVELAPLRQIAESLGYKVTWNGKARSVTLMKMMMEDKTMMEDKAMMDMTMEDTFVIHIDKKTIMVGGMNEMLMNAPAFVNGTVYVPKAFIDTYLLN